MTKSIVIATHPLLACLAEAEKLANGLASPWGSDKTEGAEFIRSCVPDMPDCTKIAEMKSRASRNVAEINQWLRSEGFSIQLPETGDVYIASVMKLLVQWLSRGEENRIGDFNGVKLGPMTAQVIYEQSWSQEEYVVRISTKNQDDMVYMCMPSGPEPKNEWDVIKRIAAYDIALRRENADVRTSGKYNVGVVFPQVQLNLEPDVSWLEDMRAVGNDGKPIIITCCKQQVKLQLDLEGAKVEAAAAMCITRGCGGPIPFVIDRPFLFWIRRKGVSDPLIWAYLCPDTWVQK